MNEIKKNFLTVETFTLILMFILIVVLTKANIVWSFSLLIVILVVYHLIRRFKPIQIVFRFLTALTSLIYVGFGLYIIFNAPNANNNEKYPDLLLDPNVATLLGTGLAMLATGALIISLVNDMFKGFKKEDDTEKILAELANLNVDYEKKTRQLAQAIRSKSK